MRPKMKVVRKVYDLYNAKGTKRMAIGQKWFASAYEHGGVIRDFEWIFEIINKIYYRDKIYWAAIKLGGEPDTDQMILVDEYGKQVGSLGFQFFFTDRSKTKETRVKND